MRLCLAKLTLMDEGFFGSMGTSILAVSRKLRKSASRMLAPELADPLKLMFIEKLADVRHPDYPEKCLLTASYY